MSKIGYELSTAPAYLEIHRYRMRQKRRKYLMIGSVGILILIVLYTNRRAIQGNYRKVILGSVSFEVVESMFQRDDSPILVIHPDGKRIDTITNSETYKALFFSPHLAVDEISTSHNANSAYVSSKLDPLVDLSSGDEEEFEDEEMSDPIQVLNIKTDEVEVYIDDGDPDPSKASSSTSADDQEVSRSSELEETVIQQVPEVSEQQEESKLITQPEETQPENETDVKKVGRKLPGFPGGLRALTQYMKDNMRYPKEALNNQIEGVVYISFMINTSGQVEKPTVFKSLGYGCDEEALRLVTNMPSWNPGTNDGAPEAMSYTLPVTFRTK